MEDFNKKMKMVLALNKKIEEITAPIRRYQQLAGKLSAMNVLSATIYGDIQRQVRYLNTRHTLHQFSKPIEDVQRISSLIKHATSRSAELSKVIENAQRLAAYTRVIEDLVKLPHYTNEMFDNAESDIENLDLSESHLQEVDQEIESYKAGSFSHLTEKTKYFFFQFLMFLFISSKITGINGKDIWNKYSIPEAQEVLQASAAPATVKSIFRKLPSTEEKYRALSSLELKGLLRVTTVRGLCLRNKAKIKSAVIEELPIGTFVRVIDNTKKSWIFVEVKINGSFTYGWVLRRYTTRFKNHI